MAKGVTTRIRFIEKGEAALRFCPHCGEKAGRRNGTRRGQQQFVCRACRKTWVGEMPLPPVDQICPYCKGRCIKYGTLLVPFGEWYRELGAARNAAYDRGTEFVADSRVKRERFQRYCCTVCGRQNGGLWPLRRPYKYESRCDRPVRILLDTRATQRLVEYCQSHKMSEAQAVRDIFGQAANRMMKTGVRVSSSWDYLERKDDGVTLLPRLPNGNYRLWNEMRERGTFGEATVYIVYATTVNLDRKAYIGLLRTILHYDLTRQEAARKLIREAGVAAPRRCVGCVGSPDEDYPPRFRSLYVGI